MTGSSRAMEDAGSVLRRLLPGLGQYAGYRRSWLRSDVLAGLTVAAYLVPQVMT